MNNYIFNVDGVVMYPNTDSDFIKKGAKIEGEKHKQITLQGNLKFVDVDADYVYLIAQPLDKKISVVIDRKLSNGTIQYGYFVGYFYLTDSEIDKDLHIITVALTPDDEFTELEAYKDVSVQLKDLDTLGQTRVYAKKMSFIQIYVIGDTRLTNYSNGSYWEQSCTQVSQYEGSTLEGRAFRGACYIDGDFQVSGVYIGSFNDTSDGSVRSWVSQDGLYEILPIAESGEIKWAIFEVATNTPVWVTEQKTGTYDIELTEFTFNNIFTPTLETTCLEVKRILNWVVSGNTQFEGVDCDEKDNDFCNNEAYAYQIEVSDPILGIEFLFSDATEVEPTEYNIAENTDYFSKLESDNSYDTIPFGNSVWGNFSMWVKGSNTHYELMENNLIYEYTYGYSIQQLIKALFTYHGISLSYEENSVFSKFFYDAINPINSLSKLNYLYIPKNNLLGYLISSNTPSREDSISLNDIFEHCKRLFRVFRTIDNGKLVLEHANWYDRGKSYDSEGLTQKDLTILIQPQNSKALAYGINKFKFEKQNTIRFYTYGYDSSSKIYNGTSIEVMSEGVLKGEESRETSGLSADINYIRINSQDEADEGLVLVACSQTYLGQYNEILTELNDDTGYFTKMQNSYMQIPSLQKQFATLDLPFNNALINGVETSVDGISRIKYHDTVEFALKDLENDLNMYKFVKTAEGLGEITDMQLSMDMRTVKLKLNYDINS